MKTDMKGDGSKEYNEGGRGMMRGERSAWKVKGVMRGGGWGGGGQNAMLSHDKACSLYT